MTDHSYLEALTEPPHDDGKCRHQGCGEPLQSEDEYDRQECTPCWEEGIRARYENR